MLCCIRRIKLYYIFPCKKVSKGEMGLNEAKVKKMFELLTKRMCVQQLIMHWFILLVRNVASIACMLNKLKDL